MSPSEIAVSVAINAKACAASLRRIEMLVGLIAGGVLYLVAHAKGWV